MLADVGRVVVFGGPSLALVGPLERERLELRPPVRRGDLEELAQRPEPCRVLVLDGVFGYQLAITPTECRILLERGWQVAGAASMGALRAADLWSLGMVGIGDVYTLYRLGHLRSDADVAVVYSEPLGKEITASLVHVRAVLAELERRQAVTVELSRQLLAEARGLYWMSREWPSVLEAWSQADLPTEALAAARQIAADPWLHPKKRDGLLAVRSMLGERWVQPLPGPPGGGS